MIQRILEQEQAIRQILSTDRKTTQLIPSWQDIEVLESVSKALNPVADFTDILSGEDYVTVSSVKPLLQHLSHELLVEDDDHTQLTRDIKEHINSYMELKYDSTEVTELLNATSFLDPRFKTDYVDVDGVDTVKQMIEQEGTEVALNLELGEMPESDNSSANTEASGPPSKKESLGASSRRAELWNSQDFCKLHKSRPKLNWRSI